MNNIEEIATSFAREYGNDAIYPSHLFKAILHKDIGMVHFIETDLDKDYYYLQEWADVQMQLSPKTARPVRDPHYSQEAVHWSIRHHPSGLICSHGKIYGCST